VEYAQPYGHAVNGYGGLRDGRYAVNTFDASGRQAVQRNIFDKQGGTLKETWTGDERSYTFIDPYWHIPCWRVLLQLPANGGGHPVTGVRGAGGYSFTLLSMNTTLGQNSRTAATGLHGRSGVRPAAGCTSRSS
jgi:hypothetical protein